MDYKKKKIIERYNRDIIETIWKDFETEVLPASQGFSDAQRAEMKKAFFSGSFATLQTIKMAAGLSASKQDILDVTAALTHECKAFIYGTRDKHVEGN